MESPTRQRQLEELDQVRAFVPVFLYLGHGMNCM